jgi:hypothetical protein
VPLAEIVTPRNWTEPTVNVHNDLIRVVVDIDIVIVIYLHFHFRRSFDVVVETKRGNFAIGSDLEFGAVVSSERRILEVLDEVGRALCFCSAYDKKSVNHGEVSPPISGGLFLWLVRFPAVAVRYG